MAGPHSGPMEQIALGARNEANNRKATARFIVVIRIGDLYMNVLEERAFNKCFRRV